VSVVQPFPQYFAGLYCSHFISNDEFDYEAEHQRGFDFLAGLGVSGKFVIPDSYTGLKNNYKLLAWAGFFRIKWKTIFYGSTVYEDSAWSFGTWSDGPWYAVPLFNGSIDYNTAGTTNSTKSFKGERLTREPKEDFDFEIVAELDLNKSQTLDLVIFGERLLSAISKK
jgi:hypothetical protein